jgi:orotidine-5'-phosphate decarboxylase
MDSRLRNIVPNERLIFALDVPDVERAMELVGDLTPSVKYFKVGLELFLAGGFTVIDQIGKAGGKVFLDLKMLDIPATVRNSLQVIASQHRTIAFTTIHVLNKGFEGFLENSSISENLNVLVVTVLTSMDDKDWAETGAERNVQESVSFLTDRALQLGCQGVISSALEARELRDKYGEDFLIVAPGIRPVGTQVENDDQKRTCTPKEAIMNGADYLVVGRPIRDVPDPLEAAQAIQAEIEAALEELESKSSNGPEDTSNLLEAG